VYGAFGPPAIAPLGSSGDGYYQTHNVNIFPYAALGLVTGVALTAQAQCEVPPSPEAVQEAMLARRRENVRRYVDELVLKTDTASFLPQVVEKEIYAGVLMLVVSMLHETALQMQGTGVLGHELQINLVEANLPPVAKGIDIPDFGPIADMFLADEEINVRAVPDFIERQLYINILSMLYGLMYEISRSANIQSMGMKLSLALSPSLEQFESAGGFSHDFEIDPATIDQQLKAAGVELDGGHLYSGLQEKLYRDFFKFLLCSAAAVLDTTKMRVFDCDIELKLGKLDELPHMAGVKPTKAAATLQKDKLQAELQALRKEEALIEQRTHRRLAEVEARKKEIKKLLRN